MREERKLRVFENMVLRRIFGPRREEVAGEWRRLHNEELNDLSTTFYYVWFGAESVVFLVAIQKFKD